MKIRFITPKDYKKCNDFYNRIYNSNRKLKQWEWEFLYNKNGKKIPFVVVEHNNKIVGTQALIPIKMIDSKGIFWSAKSEETLLDPGMRGKGLFYKMYNLLFEYAEKNHILSIWGFTTAEKPFKKVGFEIPYYNTHLLFPFTNKVVDILMNKYSKKKLTIKQKIKKKIYTYCMTLVNIYSLIRYNLKKLNIKLSNYKGINIKILDSPPQDAGNLCKEFIEQWGGVTLYRDNEYLNWRIFNNPYISPIFKAIYTDNKLIGWISYALDDDSIGYIVDIMVASGKDNDILSVIAIKLLLNDVIKSLKGMGAISVRTWNVSCHPFDKLILKIARSMGFVHIKRKGSSIVFRVLKNIKYRISIIDYNNWYISRIYTQGWLG